MKIEQKASDQRASRALLAHIRAKYETIPAFSEATGIDRIKIQKAIRGEIIRMDVEFAFAIEKATAGAVPAAWWVGIEAKAAS